MRQASEDGVNVAPGSQLQRARAGDTHALGVLLSGFRDYLLVIANGELDAAVRAKCGPSDVVQDTFISAQRAFHQFAGATTAELQHWLKQIVLNRCRDMHAAYRDAAKRDVRREMPLEGLGSVVGPVAGLAVHTKTPSRHAIKAEEAAQIVAALQTLPEDMRRAVWLRNWECLPFDEIGRRLERSSEAARKLFSRGVRQLGQILEESHEAGPLSR